MATVDADAQILEGLNEQQAAAVCHPDTPLLIIAGAGSGKTRTLVHRVARLISQGADPRRIMLLTFTRRASAEMLRRVDALLRSLEHAAASSRGSAAFGRKVWGGTFHAIAAQLLRMRGNAIGLDPAFTIHDRGDSEDLMDVVRTELGLTKTDKRFPKKRTCVAIYSNAVNSQQPLEEILARDFPWCSECVDDLKRLFRGYVDRKEQSGVLDYDDLLLFWHGLLSDPVVGNAVRQRFDYVLVDEYQDTNRLQGKILKLLRPDGAGLTAVGDDAQSIYSFRAATVRNILDFPQEWPAATVLKLEQNYRSTQPILQATNHVIAQARERFTKDLWSQRKGGEQPSLVTCADENDQAEFVARKVLEHREAGIDLRRQAVLFRAAHHSILLEAELSSRNIPFVKYGGLKFIETAHVRDLMAFLRLAENPRDLVAGARVLLLLPGVGPKTAQHLMQVLALAGGNFSIWVTTKAPAATGEHWPNLAKLMMQLTAAPRGDVQAQVHAVLNYYAPILEERYDHASARMRDLEQLEQLAGRFSDRATMLADLTLDPPTSSQDFAGPPHLDEDYLILSTIHSAKGLEWDCVCVIHAADGNIPSDMSTGTSEQIEEELRLFYVALTRAKSWLYVLVPQRYYHVARGPRADRYGFAQVTRFLPKKLRRYFQCCTATGPADPLRAAESPHAAPEIRKQLKAMWS